MLSGVVKIMLSEKKIIVLKMGLVLLHSESSCKAIYAVVLNLLVCVVLGKCRILKSL